VELCETHGSLVSLIVLVLLWARQFVWQERFCWKVHLGKMGLKVAVQL
jgi:hypothetical protein